MTPSPTRAALYTRASTQEQADHNHRLDTQDVKLTALAELQGLMVVRRYVDGGHSGTKSEQPGHNQLRDDAQTGEFDTLLIHCLSESHTALPLPLTATLQGDELAVMARTSRCTRTAGLT